MVAGRPRWVSQLCGLLTLYSFEPVSSKVETVNVQISTVYFIFHSISYFYPKSNWSWFEAKAGENGIWPWSLINFTQVVLWDIVCPLYVSGPHKWPRLQSHFAPSDKYLSNCWPDYLYVKCCLHTLWPRKWEEDLRQGAEAEFWFAFIKQHLGWVNLLSVVHLPVQFQILYHL